MQGVVPGRILLVEDEPALARVYARALLASGFQIEHEPNGVRGLARALEVDFDVVVSDVCMPEMDGIELLRHLRVQRPDIPVILLTARLDASTYGRARDLGSVRYLLKPVRMEQLARAVQNAFELRAAWRRRSARRAAAG
jgi:two-component system response regulator TctD